MDAPSQILNILLIINITVDIKLTNMIVSPSLSRRTSPVLFSPANISASLKILFAMRADVFSVSPGENTSCIFH